MVFGVIIITAVFMLNSQDDGVIAGDMEGKTICVFADAAAWPVQSYIAKFREEFEQWISGGCKADDVEAVHA